MLHENEWKCDVDECSSVSHNCLFKSVCGNIFGTYNCTCKQGFENSKYGNTWISNGGSHTCTDIKECSQGQVTDYNKKIVTTRGLLQFFGNLKYNTSRHLAKKINVMPTTLVRNWRVVMNVCVNPDIQTMAYRRPVRIRKKKCATK